MTVQTTTSRADYTGNGATTAFTIPFYVLDTSHVRVLRTQISTGVVTTLAYSTDYTVTLGGATSTLTMASPPSSDQRISILRNVPFTQLTHYVENDPFPAASHERALDQLTMEVQQLSEVQGRALVLPSNTPTGTSAELPSAAANSLIGWNSTATALENKDPQALATLVAYGTANSDIFTGDGTTTVWTLTDNPGNVNNLDVSIGGVAQLPGTDYTWSSGKTFTTTAPVPSGVKMLVRYMQGLPQASTALPNQSGNAGKFLTTNGSVASWAAVSGGFKNLKSDYGAVGDGTTDDTAKVIAAIADCAATGRALFIPTGTYSVTSQITISRWCHIFGEGREKSLIVYNGTTLTGANGVIQITPPSSPANSNRFYRLHDFGVAPGSGQASNGIRVVLATGAYFSNFDFEHLYVGDFTSYGISLDNTVANGDGFFTGRVSRCWITNGFQGIKIGDSVFVEHNTITQGSLTRTQTGILVTGLGGARNCAISHNNITCAGGAMVLIDCEQYTIENNQCEHPFYNGVDYLGTYNAFIYGYNIKWCRFINNTFQTGAATIVGPGYTVLLEGTTNYCKFNSFERCKFFKGETAHINYGVGAVLNSAPEQKNTFDSAATYVISDATYPNYEVEMPLSLVNSWTTHSLSNAPTIYFEESGWATVRGFVSNASPGAPGDGSIAVLPLLVNVINGRQRFITQANGSDSSNSVIQAYSGKIWAITAPTTSLTGLDGVRFKYGLTIPE